MSLKYVSNSLDGKDLMIRDVYILGSTAVPIASA